jgi:hypothetical protein
MISPAQDLRYRLIVNLDLNVDPHPPRDRHRDKPTPRHSWNRTVKCWQRRGRLHVEETRLGAARGRRPKTSGLIRAGGSGPISNGSTPSARQNLSYFGRSNARAGPCLCCGQEVDLHVDEVVRFLSGMVSGDPR